jgi:glucose-6-phosphate 1-dehydrogenase
MTDGRSGALVFFAATGDLAYKKIFPELHAMVNVWGPHEIDSSVLPPGGRRHRMVMVI